MHDCPRFIDLKGHKLKLDLASNHFMSDDVFDICLRRLKQLDQMLFPTDIPIRWRHMFESDYAVSDCVPKHFMSASFK